MEIKTKLEEVRAQARLQHLAGFRRIKHVDIPEIPRNKTRFPGTENDYWYLVDIPFMDITACIYELDEKSTFPPHLHNVNTEQIIMLTKGSEVEVVTNKYIKTYNATERIIFKPNEPHAVINKTKGVTVLLVLWTPKMNGFNLSYIDKNEVQVTPAKT